MTTNILTQRVGPLDGLNPQMNKLGGERSKGLARTAASDMLRQGRQKECKELMSDMCRTVVVKGRSTSKDA